MKCRACQKEISVLDRKCPYCGASTTPMLDRETNEPSPAAYPARAKQQGPFLWKLDEGDQPDESEIAEIQDILEAPLDKEIFQISNFVFYSPHVQNNIAYRRRAAEVTLAYAPDIDDVNAFATDMPNPEVGAKPPMIVVCEGLIRAIRLAALGLGYSRQMGGAKGQKTLISIIQAIGYKIVENKGAFDQDAALRILEIPDMLKASQDYEVQSWARSYRAAMIMGIISHELGHIALGHTLGELMNRQISRNQEREADSFAASIISSSPFSDYLVTGIIFFWLILSWADSALPENSDNTHPHAKERLFDFIRSNREQAQAIGITEETITDFLPA